MYLCDFQPPAQPEEGIKERGSHQGRQQHRCAILLLVMCCVGIVSCSRTALAGDLPPSFTAASYAGTGDNVPFSGTTLEVAQMLSAASPSPSAIFTATDLNFVGALTINCPATPGDWTAATTLLVTVINGGSDPGRNVINPHIKMYGVLSRGSKVSIQGGTYKFYRYLEFLSRFTAMDNSVVEVVGGATFTPAILSGGINAIMYTNGDLTVSDGGVVTVSDAAISASDITGNVEFYALYAKNLALSGRSMLNISALSMFMSDYSSPTSTVQLHALGMSSSLKLTITSNSEVSISDILFNVSRVEADECVVGAMYIHYVSMTVSDGSRVSVRNTRVLLDSVSATTSVEPIVVWLGPRTLRISNFSTLDVHNHSIDFHNVTSFSKLSISAVNVVYSTFLEDNSAVSITGMNVTTHEAAGGSGDLQLNVLYLKRGATVSNNSTITLSNHTHRQKKSTAPDDAGVLTAIDLVSLSHDCAIRVSNIQIFHADITIPTSYSNYAVLHFVGGLRLDNNATVSAIDVTMERTGVSGASLSTTSRPRFAVMHIRKLTSTTSFIRGGSSITLSRTSIAVDSVSSNVNDMLVATLRMDRIDISNSSSIQIDNYINSIARGQMQDDVRNSALAVYTALSVDGGSYISILNGTLEMKDLDIVTGSTTSSTELLLYMATLYGAFSPETFISLSNISKVTVLGNTIEVSNTSLASLHVSFIDSNIIMASKSMGVVSNNRLFMINTNISNYARVASVYCSALDVSNESSLLLTDLTVTLSGYHSVASGKSIRVSHVTPLALRVDSNSRLAISHSNLSVVNAAVHAIVLTPLDDPLSGSDFTVSNGSGIVIKGNVASLRNSSIAGSAHIVGGLHIQGGTADTKSFVDGSFLNITDNNVVSSGNELVGDAAVANSTTSTLLDILYFTNSGLGIDATSSLLLAGNDLLVEASTSASSSLSRRVEAGAVTTTTMVYFSGNVNTWFNGTVLIDRNVVTGGDASMIFGSTKFYGSIRFSYNNITTTSGSATMFVLLSSILPTTIFSCFNFINKLPCDVSDNMCISNRSNAALSGRLYECDPGDVSSSPPPSSIPPTGSPPSSNTNNAKFSTSSAITSVRYSEAGFVAVTGISGLLGILGGTVDSTGNLQIAAMFSYMSCGVVSVKSVYVERILLPLRIADTHASNLAGSLVLLVAITVVYYTITALVISIARRSTSQNQHSNQDSTTFPTQDRVILIKRLMLYPHLPFFGLVLLLPGISIESCSLVYGRLRGGQGWEVFLGVVGMAISFAVAAYCVVVGVCVRRRILNASLQQQQHTTTNNENVNSPDALHESNHTYDSAPNEHGGAIHPKSGDAEASSYPSQCYNHIAIGNNRHPTYNVYTQPQREALPKLAQFSILPATYWTDPCAIAVGPLFAYRPDFISITCGHHVVFVVLMGVIGAVEGKSDYDCHLVQGFLAALCFVHAVFVGVARPYRIPVVTILQAAQSLLLGLLACSGAIGKTDTNTAFTVLLLITSFVTVVLTLLVVLVECWIQHTSARRSTSHKYDIPTTIAAATPNNSDSDGTHVAEESRHPSQSTPEATDTPSVSAIH